MPTIENAVGGGDLGVEIDLHEISKEIDFPDLRYEPEFYPGLCFKFERDGGTVMLFTSGNYNIAGARSIKELQDINQKLITLIESLLDENLNDANGRFEIRNLVYLSEYPNELELSKLPAGLDGGNAEYDPEIHPGVRYQPYYCSGVFFIFRSGKVMMTGAADANMVQTAFDSLFSEIDDLFKTV